MSKDLLKNKKKAELLEIIERQSNAIGALVDKLEALNAKIDNLQREDADLKIMIYRLQQEKAQAVGQIAEYQATLMTQKALIETLEKRLTLYRKNEN